MMLALIAGLFLSLAPESRAAHPSALGYPGFGLYSSPYSLGQVPVPPYFALHPPVYYSYPVPRSYGYSPFAYPGTTETPTITVPAAAMIVNPHVSPVKGSVTEGKPAEDKTAAVTYEVINNPFASGRQTRVATFVK
jgi:hypothetical protein